MFERDAILSKISIIQNCLKTIQKTTQLDPSKLEDYLVQDSFVLNTQRAAQACIDMAHLVISQKGFKLPANYKEAFTTLEKEKWITSSCARKMEKMVGFRNIAVHDYQALDLGILKSILKDHMKDFEEFYTQIFEKMGK